MVASHCSCQGEAKGCGTHHQDVALAVRDPTGSSAASIRASQPLPTGKPEFLPTCGEHWLPTAQSDTVTWPKPGELPQGQQAGDPTASPCHLGWGRRGGGKTCFISNYKKQTCFIRIMSGC